MTTANELEAFKSELEAKINAWHQRLVHGTVIQREEQLFKHVHDRIQELKAELMGSKPEENTITNEE